jgi:hypothetical protein
VSPRFQQNEASRIFDSPLPSIREKIRLTVFLCAWVAQLFEWIKQHLRIKAFFETPENALKTQIWIGISVYVLVAIIKKRPKLPR